MITIRDIEQKDEWEQFLFSQPWTPFFQSWNWGGVQERLGHRIFRFGLYDGKKLVGICLAVVVEAKRGRYLHLRHGPLLSNFEKQFQQFLEYLKEHVSRLKLDFIRMSPLLVEVSMDSHSGPANGGIPLRRDLSRIDSGVANAPQNDEFNNMKFLRRFGFRNAPIHNMDAENAWVLDLDKSEAELLAGMRKTTRYLVKKAQTLPITISAATNKRDFEAFMKLYEITSKRHKFVPHRGVQEEFELFTKEDQAKLFVARYKRKILAGALIIFYGDQAIYHHGASSDEYREIPAAYLVQWEAIKEAKKQGKKLYNFWGVVPPEKPKHPWQGLTLFKMGFGGRRLNFIHAQDLPLSINYWKTFAIESAWRIYRGY